MLHEKCWFSPYSDTYEVLVKIPDRGLDIDSHCE